MTTAKNIAGTEEDFRQGYQDAYNELGYRPTTVRYVDGYRRGLDVRQILRPKTKNTCPCPDCQQE